MVFSNTSPIRAFVCFCVFLYCCYITTQKLLLSDKSVIWEAPWQKCTGYLVSMGTAMDLNYTFWSVQRYNVSHIGISTHSKIWVIQLKLLLQRLTKFVSHNLIKFSYHFSKITGLVFSTISLNSFNHIWAIQLRWILKS